MDETQTSTARTPAAPSAATRSGAGSARGGRRGGSRERLLAAARALFVERGFHATRPQDISKAAGVGHGTFYLHFKDKQECFLAFAEEAGDELEQFIAERVPEDADPYRVIRDTIHYTYEFALAHPGLIAAALADTSVIDGKGSSVLMERFGNQWAERFAAWKADGLIGGHVDPEIVGHAMPGMIRQVGAHAAQSDGDATNAVAGLMAFVAAGLGLSNRETTPGTTTGAPEQAGDEPA